jgi:hypothetical protein
MFMTSLFCVVFAGCSNTSQKCNSGSGVIEPWPQRNYESQRWSRVVDINTGYLCECVCVSVCVSGIIQQVYYYWLLYEIRRGRMSRSNYREGRPELNLGRHFTGAIIFKYQMHVNNVISNFHGKQSIVCTFKKIVQINAVQLYEVLGTRTQAITFGRCLPVVIGITNCPCANH